MLLLEETKAQSDAAAAEADRLARSDRRRARVRDAGVLTGIVSIVAGILFVVLLSPGGLLADDGDTGSLADAGHASHGVAPAPAADEAEGVKFERFERVNPELPAIPAGAVKRFKVDVYEHVTKVSDELAPTEVWSFAINGVEHRGTGVSDPMVVEVGDKVRIDLVNGSSARMNVRMPHSIDFHSSEVNPGAAFKTIGPGEEHSFEFVAKHPGVFMYHCATDPVLHHTGAGMVGAMIVKPKNLAPVDRELWITQQEFYIGKAGGQADMQKMQAKQPDVIAFNGYAAQYKKDPIVVTKGERIRMFVMNAGPSIWSAFHVIGTVFDKTRVEGVEGSHAQTINLAPSQGGWVEFTLDQEGTYPFVTHAFGDMVKGSVGVLATEHAPGGAMKH
jgi:nitrite reductase (NO-forming)